MAEAPSSSSSFSSAPTDNLGTPVGKRPRSEVFFLVVRKQPPGFVYPNERFELEFAIDGGSSSSASPPTDVEVLASIININPTSIASECSLEVIAAPRISPSRKTGTIKCFIRSPRVSRRHGCSMQIHLRVNDDSRGIAPCTTRTICLVNSKILVSMTSDWTESPYTWFKDEGGRDKCMEGDVTLWNERNENVKESLLLDLTLCYDGDNKVAVSKQELLRRIGAEQMLQIDESTGSAKIRFRVEDVSKNHQRQNFVVKISPAKATIRDIAPAFTPPVSVRSKRSRHKQKQGLARPSPPDPQPELSPPSDSGRRSSSLSEIGGFEGLDPIRLRNAVQAIVRWADDVVNSLSWMQWKFIGYEHRPDGSVDFNRPLHNFPNPNPTIERVLALYHDSVRFDLGYLQGAVEQNTSTRSGASAPVRASAYTAPTSQSTQSVGGQIQTPSFASGMGSQHFSPSADYGRFPVPHQQQTQPYNPFFFPGQPQAHGAQPAPREESPVDDRKVASTIDRESEVEFVLAKQYKSVRTGEPLGFPAFSADHEILGFYRESSTGVGASHFDPIQRHDFQPADKHDARKILEEAIISKSRVVHARKDWESMASLIDHCLVYSFSNGGIDSNSSDTTG